ncbi:MAG: hypothetical protein ACRD3D_03165 [Terriglobia bacterium]
MMRGREHHRWWKIVAAAGVFATLLAARPSICASAAIAGTQLDFGYLDMYDLRFHDARKAFDEWQRLHPEDPMGPVSEAASYLFSEFDRMGILRSQLFTDDKQFKQRKKPAHDPASWNAFNRALDLSQQLADAILTSDPRNTNALFAELLSRGLRADHLALIEGRDLAALPYMKSAGVLANRLLKIDPSLYDAYLAVGVEKYLLSLNPAPVRWALRLYGVQGDKMQGIRELELTAERGHYLLPYARLLLAIAALRDHNKTRAAALLRGLAHEFPDNRLYTTELARLE